MTTALPSRSLDFGFQDISKKDVVLGVAGASVSLSAGYAAMKATESLLCRWIGKCSQLQAHFHLYKYVEGISNEFLRRSLEISVTAYAVLLIPIVEEWLFRDVIHSKLEEKIPGNGLSSRVLRVFASGAIFGAVHFGFAPGWMNILMFVVSAVTGVVFAVLREITGNRWAPTFAHVLNNSFMLFLLSSNVLKI